MTAPVMCRQCEDAPCAKVCPNHAIVQEDHYVKVLQSRCIGCKTCAIACPYGAMDVVTKQVEQTEGAYALFNRVVTESRALKCDLCSHRQGGPACMEVCPTNALKLVSLEEVESLKKKKRTAAVDEAVSLSF
ncbi:4Fe-4S dicluster domain-containing protein [Vibrio variabilis]|uniref:4Fe-4S dicluster domain-containing protein n=1 Tax=Vibrio variabilis TaxID=990271 RepID=UPI001EFA2801|nr:4Fe-4S dicluster domain-containing protein [Vibrio variabilis]